MQRQPVENLRAANNLYLEARRGGLKAGCLEVSLQALGVPMEYLDILDREKQRSKITDIIQRAGLITSWIAQLPPQIDLKQLEDLLEDKMVTNFPVNQGVVTGYLCLEHYPDREEDHAIAILPRGLQPRDVRRQLKALNAYIVVDTNEDGVTPRSLKELQMYVRAVSEAGGQLGIAQIKRPRLRTR